MIFTSIEPEEIKSDFQSEKISAGLMVIAINQFDVGSFSQKFRDWVNENQTLFPENSNTPVIFHIEPNLVIDSADLALILEVARQLNIVPLGFVKSQKIVKDYASFAHLALFDPKELQKQTKTDENDSAHPSAGEILKQKLQDWIHKPESIPEPDSEDDNSAEAKNNNEFENTGWYVNPELFFGKPPEYIHEDVRGELSFDEVAFIHGNVFLSAEIEAKECVYIYGQCFGQVSVHSELGQIYIQRLRARRIRIGPYNLESSEFDPNLIDQPVVFYLNRQKIEVKKVAG